MFKNVPVTPRAKATPVPKEKPEWQFTYSARNCSAVLGPDVSLDIPRLFYFAQNGNRKPVDVNKYFIILCSKPCNGPRRIINLRS